jgi:HPt (histidine-containing phosphotransfer) domain-containing protein
MDCQMPQMDGYDATMMIRSFEDEEMHTPIIAMTASAISGERERCLASGMDDFLTKPVEVDVLRETLDRWVPPRDEDAGAGPSVASTPWVAPGAAARATPPPPAPTADPDAPVLVVDDEVARQVAGVLDVNRLDELLALDPEDPSLVLRMVDRFPDNTGESLAALEAACAEGDAGGVERAAHRLKGTASNLGAKVLAARSLDVELTGDRGEVPEGAAVADLARLREEAIAALETFANPLRSMV